MVAPTSLLLRASLELADCPDRRSFLAAAAREVQRLIPGDDVIWFESDFAARRCEAWRGAHLDPQLGQQMAHAVDYPVLVSYLDRPADRSPRRLSDVASRAHWRRTATHELLDRSIGEHQLSMLVTMVPPAAGTAWVVGRHHRDFTDDELELSHGLLALMVALDRLHAPTRSEAGPGSEEAADRLGLTPRERDVLALVAQGMTAYSIARVRRISVGTVRKHLQNAYAKLGVSDRLMAVQTAQRAGLLP